MKKSLFRFVSVVSFLPISLVMSLFACTKITQKLKFEDEYKGVFLDNGQIFFGRIEEEGPFFVLLRDVFYVQSQIVRKDKDTREAKNILKKGKRVAWT
ncbi:MAG: hypothetical protein QXI12_09305 [Candidatus Methanomethyliaceae archaeon]